MTDQSTDPYLEELIEKYDKKNKDYCFDRQGRPITFFQYAELFEDMKYRVIRQDHLPDGIWISTVWLGINHNFGHGRPHIFETMCFERGEPGDMYRYSTEEAALALHKIIYVLLLMDQKYLNQLRGPLAKN